MRGVDITEDILPLLPENLWTLVAQIGSKVGAPVQFIRVASVGARAKAQAYIHNGRPLVEIVGGYHYIPALWAEELLHLQRRAEGHPGVTATESGAILGYKLICNALTGLVDEFAFKARLLEWGYGEEFHAELERAFRGYAEQGSNLLENRALISRPGGAAELEDVETVKFALEYARAKLLAAPTASRHPFLALYRHPLLAAAARLGERLAVAIQGNTDPTPSGTVRLLDVCVRQILQLPQGSYRVEVTT